MQTLTLSRAISRQLLRWGVIPILATVLVASAIQSSLISRSDHRRLDSRLTNDQSRWEQAILKADYSQLRQEVQSLVSSEDWTCALLLDDTNTVVASYPRMDWVGLPSEKVSCSGYLWKFPISARQDGSLIWRQRSLTSGIKQILAGVFISVLSLIALLLLMRRLTRELNDYTARVSAEIDSLKATEDSDFRLSGNHQSAHDLKELQVIRSAVERLRLQNEALSRTRELAAAADGRSRLAQQVAHDIRSPLAAMNALLSISTSLPEDEAILLRAAASRVREIADDLLDNTRPQLSHDPERIIQEGLRMGHLLRSLISETSLVYQKRPQLSFSLQLEGDSAEIHVPVAPSELRRAISNLLNNAAESIDGPGKVTVRLAHEQQMLVISVSDTGIGIPEYIRARLGSVGYSYGKSGGNGLGLHQVMTFAKSAGGRVEIQSVVKHGTTVSVFIPCD